MLIYQGFSASQGCQKNIFRQNPLHPFSVLWISYRTRVRFAATSGYIFLTWGKAYSMHPWISASLMRTNPPMSPGVFAPTFPRSVSSSGGGRPSFLRDSRSHGGDHASFSGVILLSNIFSVRGGGLMPPGVELGTRRPASFALRQRLVSSYKSQTAHSAVFGITPR